jgi:hypothetical protein
LNTLLSFHSLSSSSSRSEPFESNLVFSSLSLDFDYNLAIHLSLISASICYRKKSSVLKKSLSTSSPTPRLKKKTPRLNRGPVINCAVAFNICNMICGTSPPVAMLNVNAA